MTAAQNPPEATQPADPAPMKPLNVRVSDEQRAELQRQADEAGMKISDWLRYKLGLEVVLPAPDQPMLMVPKQLMETLDGVWRAAGYASLEEFVEAAIEGATHRELAALARRVGDLADRDGVAVLGGPVRKFEVRTVACRHPDASRVHRGGVTSCGLCGGRLGRA